MNTQLKYSRLIATNCQMKYDFLWHWAHFVNLFHPITSHLVALIPFLKSDVILPWFSVQFMDIISTRIIIVRLRQRQRHRLRLFPFHSYILHNYYLKYTLCIYKYTINIHACMYVLYIVYVYVAFAIFAFVSPLSIVPISNGTIKANRELSFLCMLWIW